MFPRSSSRGLPALAAILLTVLAGCSTDASPPDDGGPTPPVVTAPTITGGPTSASVSAGLSVTLSVAVSGTGPFTYQWRRDGVNIAGATGATYTTPDLTMGDNGAAFSVVVTNSAGSATSGTAVITVTAANGTPTANAGADATGVQGQTFQLSAAGSTDPDGDTLSYSWAIVAGNGGGISQSQEATASFQAPVTGTYIIELTVRDTNNLSSSDVVVIDVQYPRSSTAITLRELPGTLVEGSAKSVAVYLPQVAGPAGVTVTLQSADTAVASVPDSVSIPEGESVAAFMIDGLTAGSSTITATAPGLDPANVTATVIPRAFTLSTSTIDAGVIVGQSTTIRATLPAAAPAGGTRVMLAASNARATLGAAQITISAGATEGTTSLTGVQAGSVNVTGTIPGGGAGEPLSLMVIPTVANNDLSANLIDAAHAAGTISADQAAVLRVQAAFGAPELPAQYRGNNIGRLDGTGGRLANLRIASLSDAAQEAIGKYLFPPVYAGSWGESIVPQTSKASRAPMRAAAESCFEGLRGMPSSDRLPYWKFIRTGPFKVWYPTVIDPATASFNWYTAADGEAAALRVTATISQDFSRLSAVLGSVMRDGGIACNGGDDAIDVYVTRVGVGEKAQVMPYLPGECARPGWMWVAPDAIDDDVEARNIIGHELVHLFQLRIARSNCDDWRWNILDEAMAAWAFDFLYPNNNYEWRFGAGDWGYWDERFSGEWARNLFDGHGVGLSACNGYCDYPFFEYLSRKYNPSAIRHVMDATGSAGPQRALDSGLGGTGGGLQEIWPKFALAMWNDTENNVAAEWGGFENNTFHSLKEAYIEAENRTLRAELNGSPKRDISQQYMDLVTAGLDPMTNEYVNVKFTDPSVTTVVFEPKGNVLRAQYPRFRMQVIQKINGQWRQPEDWSNKAIVTWCRDKRDERIEELVIIYSNSHAGEDYLTDGEPAVNNLFDTDGKLTKLTLSNATCMPWHGTTRVTQTNEFGGIATYSATVRYKPFDDPAVDDEDEVANPQKFFVVDFGTASVETDWVNAPDGCHQRIPLRSGQIAENDSRLIIDTLTRIATGGGTTTIDGATHILECPGGDPISVTGPAPSQWLELPMEGATLSPDGRRISGTKITVNQIAGFTQVSEWTLTAEREE